MASAHAIPFSTIASFFRENNQQLSRGEIGHRDGHVLKMVYDGTVHPASLKGSVKASMRKKNYEVEISIDAEDGIIQASCTCPRGNVICHHMASLCIYAHYNVSSTDEACRWSAAKPVDVGEVQTLKDMYPRKREYKATSRNVSSNEISTFLSELEGTTVGFSWLLRPEPSEECLQIIPGIEEILASQEYVTSKDKTQYLLQKLLLDEQSIAEIVKLTVGQAANENWLIARKNRLTASKFGIILQAYKRQRFPSSLFKNLVEAYDINSVKAVQWGQEHEKTAIELFTASTGKKVEPTGLWLHKCGFLGASPDGLVEDGVVEVKCPYKYRNTSMQENLLLDKKYIIYKDPNSKKTCVNQEHVYWHQIQGQLHITSRSKCYLVVWTPQECEIISIPKVDAWSSNITLLQDFFLNKFVPYIS